MKDDPPAPPTSPVAATGGSTKRLSAQEVADLYQRYGREMRAFLAGVLRRTDLAEDALQQTFQRAAESGGAAARETIRGWLFQVAYREALLIRRR
jgi:RNA polymerase sigma-70 factor (ECF subfamily)